MRQVVDGLYVSGRPEGDSWHDRVDVLLTVAYDAYVAPPQTPNWGLAVFLPLADRDEAPDAELLAAVVALAAELVRAGKRVLVHCAAGVNRSGLVAAMILIRLGLSPSEALGRLRAVVPEALNNQTFQGLVQRAGRR